MATNTPILQTFPRRGRIRRALLGFLGLLVCAVGLYGLAGWYGTPWLVDRWLERFEATTPGRAASIAAVRFNPFTLEAELTGIDVSDEAAGAAFRARRLVIEISPESLRERRPVLASIAVQEPSLELPRVAQLAAIARAARSSGVAQSRVDRLEVVAGTAVFSRDGEQTIEIVRFDGSLAGFDGAGDTDARYEINAATASGTLIESEGSLAAPLDRAAGRLQMERAALASIAARLTGVVNRVEPAGQLKLTTDFDLTDLIGSPEIELRDADIEITDLSLTPLTEFEAVAGQVNATANLVLASAAAGIDVRGRLEWGDAAFDLRDRLVTPAQVFAFADAAVLLTADSTNLSVSLSGQLAGAGSTTLTARVPGDASATSTVAIGATDLPTEILSGYLAQALGRRLEAGRADVEVDYSRRGEDVSGELHVVARGLELAPAGAGDDSSLDFATALLENANGIIEIDLPFASNGWSVRYAMADALSARVHALTESPLATLQPLANGGAQTTAISFRPGDAALSDRALAMIGQLAEALISRPRLGVRIIGAYEPEADRTALAEQQIQLHVLLATAGPTAEARAVPVDFSSPRSQDVLDEFAGERLPAERVEEIARLFDCSEGALASLCRRGYYATIYDALVDNEEIAGSSLNRLARFRALSIADALADAGIDPERVEVVIGTEIVDSPFGIGLPIELTVAGSDTR